MRTIVNVALLLAYLWNDFTFKYLRRYFYTYEYSLEYDETAESRYVSRGYWVDNPLWFALILMLKDITVAAVVLTCLGFILYLTPLGTYYEDRRMEAYRAEREIQRQEWRIQYAREQEEAEEWRKNFALLHPTPDITRYLEPDPADCPSPVGKNPIYVVFKSDTVEKALRDYSFAYGESRVDISISNHDGKNWQAYDLKPTEYPIWVGFMDEGLTVDENTTLYVTVRAVEDGRAYPNGCDDYDCEEFGVLRALEVQEWSLAQGYNSPGRSYGTGYCLWVTLQLDDYYWPIEFLFPAPA